MRKPPALVSGRDDRQHDHTEARGGRAHAQVKPYEPEPCRAGRFLRRRAIASCSGIAARFRVRGGNSRATCLPLEVTTTSCPDATRRRYSERRFFKSLTETSIAEPNGGYNPHCSHTPGFAHRPLFGRWRDRLAVQAPGEYLGIVVDSWKKLFEGRLPFSRMTEFLQTHCPDWAEQGVKSLRWRKP